MFENFENSVSVLNDFTLAWTAKNKGFGQLFFYEKDGKIYCANEGVSKDFIKKIMTDLVDECMLED